MLQEGRDRGVAPSGHRSRVSGGCGGGGFGFHSLRDKVIDSEAHREAAHPAAVRFGSRDPRPGRRRAERLAVPRKRLRPGGAAGGGRASDAEPHASFAPTRSSSPAMRNSVSGERAAEAGGALRLRSRAHLATSDYRAAFDRNLHARFPRLRAKRGRGGKESCHEHRRDPPRTDLPGSG